MTPAFTDSRGRRFPLVLTIGLAEEIEKVLSIDLVNAHNGDALQRLAFDSKLFVQTLVMLCEETLTAQNIEVVDFVKALDGPALERAGQALEQMLVVFIRPQLRPIFQEVLAMLDQVGREKAKAVAGPIGKQLIQHELTMVERRMEAELMACTSPTACASPTSGPASPASAPARTASGNSPGSSAAAIASSGTTPPA